MEELEEIINLHGKDLLNGLLFVISYLFAFLCKKAVASTRKNVGVLLTEQQKYVSDVETSLSLKQRENEAQMARELAESKAAYKQAVDSIASLQERLEHAEKALRILIDDSEVEDENEAIAVTQKD